MSFNPQTLRTKLASSTEAADSITSTAQWILFYKRHADTVAREWAAAVTSDENKLAEIYIANEVIQQSKNKKKAEFVAAFAPVLPAALTSAYSQADLPTRDRIARVVKVWRERLVFGPDEQAAIEAALSSHAGAPAVHADLQLLAKKYAALQTAAKTDTRQARGLLDDVRAALADVEARVDALAGSLAQEIKSPEIEPLSDADTGVDAADTAAEDTAADRGGDAGADPSAAAGDEPETYTARDAQASAAAQPPDGTDEVAYADSSDDDAAAPAAQAEQAQQGPPEKKPKIDLDPKLSSFLANISKGGI